MYIITISSSLLVGILSLHHVPIPLQAVLQIIIICYVPGYEFRYVVNGSADTNSAQLVGREDGTPYVQVGNWQAHLSPFYRPLPAINSYQHFRFDSSHPGKVFARKTLDSPETEFTVMAGEASSLPVAAPVPMRAPGMNAQRQWYLFDTIREYVSDAQKDILCPRPVVAKPGAPQVWGGSNNSGGPTPAKRTR